MSHSSGPRVRIVRRRRGGITVTATELRALVERALRLSGAPKSGEAVVTLVDDNEIMALNVDTHHDMTKCAHTLTKRAIRTSNIKDMAMRFFAELTKQDPVR